MENSNFYAFLAQGFSSKERPAFRTNSAAFLSYGELDHAVAAMSGALLSTGVKPGDRVTAQVEKSLTAAVLFLATLRIGAVFNPLNTAYTPAELDYFISDAQPALLVVTPQAQFAAADLARKHGVHAVHTLDPNGEGSLAGLAKNGTANAGMALCEADTLACLLYTSGTTGRSKGAMITHGNLVSNIAALHAAWRFQPDDVLLHALPIYHVHGLFVALCTALRNGSEILWLPKFDAVQVMALLPQATVMMGVPTFYTRLLEQSGFSSALTGHMRLFVAGSAPLLAETHKSFAERTGHHILERYGMTETGMITSNPYDGERIAGTVGFPLPGITVRIAGADGAEAPAGEPGGIEVKGPNVFKGYWRMPEKTVQEFTTDGYFITGDIGVRAPDGRISIVGRAKDLIISGGFNVYPKEVETEIDALPGVIESAVIGVPHPDFGEGVIAVVTAADTALTSEQVMQALDGRLAKFKLPKKVFFVDVLPRNAMGKVQKAELRSSYKNTFLA